jgi:hypothetical protein
LKRFRYGYGVRTVDIKRKINNGCARCARYCRAPWSSRNRNTGETRRED